MIGGGQLLGVAGKVLEESVKQAIETYLKSDEGRKLLREILDNQPAQHEGQELDVYDTNELHPPNHKRMSVVAVPSDEPVGEDEIRPGVGKRFVVRSVPVQPADPEAKAVEKPRRRARSVEATSTTGGPT